ncbi:MAG: hypothetical protein EP330_17090 [Deltaproteobacteria bacterium]|nr:MAG: hypothetical protein EP330_17090 [Deltaproteobacteria bacterium]
MLRLPPIGLTALLLVGCFPALERPPALIDGDLDGFVGAEDCDDGNAAISPDADEVCNGEDEDCDGRVDEDLPSVWYPDVDEDGVGATEDPYQGCDPPDGYVTTTGDCNDGDASISSAELWYPDDDGDGYGDSRSGVSTCDPPEGWLRDGTDCDDSTAEVSPEGTETCDVNNVDEDCDGFADDADPDGAAGAVLWRVDADGDGYGAGTATEACDSPGSGYASGEADCDDTDPALHPDTQWYVDGDGDGYGTTATGSTGCSDPGSAAPRDGDCADSDDTRHPGAIEVCDVGAVDEDCDGAANEADPEGASGEQVYYLDEDGDGYGAELSATVYCTDPGGDWVLDGGDCDDADAAVNPGATEVCDDGGADEDCDGFANADDPDSQGVLTLYPDADGDGWGLAGSTGTTSCDPIPGTASQDGDCDDADPLIHPATNWCPDLDQDGWGDNTASPTVQCASPGGTYAANCADCDDGTWDEFPSGEWFVDADGDRYGDDSTRVEQCDEPDPPPVGSWALLGGDCDDSDLYTFPAAPERCQDGRENSCNGTGNDLCMPSGIVSLDELATAVSGQALSHFAGVAVADYAGANGNELAIGSPGAARSHHLPIAQGETTLRAIGAGYVGAGNFGVSMVTVDRDSIAIGDANDSLVYLVPADVALPRDASAQATATIQGPTGSYAGSGLAVGDFNGDGEDDLIVCASNGTGSVVVDNGGVVSTGRLWFVAGPHTGTTTLSSLSGGYTLPLSGSVCGHLATVPDLTGDGADELVAGLPDQELVYVFNGAKLAAGLANPREYTISAATTGSFGQGIAVGAWAGTTVLAVGAPDVGQVTLYDLEARESRAVLNDSIGFGQQVAMPGDLSGDGTADLVVANPVQGRAYVLDGDAIVVGTQAVSGRLLATLDAETPEGLLFHSGADVNDDGREDLVVRAPTHGDNRGRLWVLYGVP